MVLQLNGQPFLKTIGLLCILELKITYINAP